MIYFLNLEKNIREKYLNRNNEKYFLQTLLKHVVTRLFVVLEFSKAESFESN